MATLIINAPWNKKDKKTGHYIGLPGQSHSWETFFTKGKGLGYILFQDEFTKLHQGITTGSSKVVLLRTRGNPKRNICQRRAEALLTELKNTHRPAMNCGWRYNVSFKDQQEIFPYGYHLPKEQLEHRGVKVIITENDC